MSKLHVYVLPKLGSWALYNTVWGRKHKDLKTKVVLWLSLLIRQTGSCQYSNFGHTGNQ